MKTKNFGARRNLRRISALERHRNRISVLESLVPEEKIQELIKRLKTIVENTEKNISTQPLSTKIDRRISPGKKRHSNFS